MGDINDIPSISRYGVYLPSLAQGERSDSRRSSGTASTKIDESPVPVPVWCRHGATKISIHINMGFGMESSGMESGLLGDLESRML